MMELDDLKNELNLKLAGATRQRSSGEISSLLKANALSIVYKLKRSLQAELIVSLLFMGLCIYMIFFNDYWIYRIIFTTFSIIGIAFILVLFVLLKKVNALSAVSTVKQNLSKLVNVLDEYVKRYLQFTLVLLPACFVFGVWLSYHDEENVLKPLVWDTIVYLFLAMLALAACVYYFIRWYLGKLYGKYIQQLKVLLMEFEEPQDHNV